MAAPTYIGDEWTAAGFRLAGVEVLVSGDEDTLQMFERVLAGSSPLLLLSSGVAGQIPAARLEQARRHARPPVLVVGDPAGRERPEPLTRQLRRRMGVAE